MQPAIELEEDRTARQLADCSGQRIGILLVAYNAITTLTKVLRRIPAPVWSNVEEVAVFDDASQDATYALALGLKALGGLEKLSVLKHPENLGYGGNQKAGYHYFLEKGFDIVVLLHGDGQYAPEVLARMYHPLVAGEADAVFGSRMMRDYGGPLKGGMPLYKYAGNRILTTLENRALGMDLTEFHSGYRAYSLRALRGIDFSHMSGDFHFDTEIIIKLHHQGFRIREVPIPTYYGTEICYVDGLKYARNVMRAVYRYSRTKRSIERYPEFAEYFVRYPTKASSHSSHNYVRSCISAGQEVLDVGCDQGDLASEFHAAGARVYGVDALPVPQHLPVFEQYVQRDLDFGLGNAFSGRCFDRILLMDVLEHLRSPEALLAECRDLLKPGGQVIISVPNVGNITVRLALLFGKWNYADRGIMDRTHLRFYTRKTAQRMVETAGYRVVDQRMTVMPVEVVLGPPERNPILGFIHRLLIALTAILPNLFGYQTFIVAEKNE